MSEKYPFQPAFEVAIAYHAATNPGFMGRAGHALDPERMTTPLPKLLVQVATSIFREQGRGPSSATLALQRLRRWMDDGRVTYEDLCGASDLVDAVELDAKRLDETDVLSELVPILRRSMQQEAAIAAADDYANERDFDKTIGLAEKARRLGDVDESIGTRLGEGSAELIRELNTYERLPIGVPEVDLRIRGGLRRGCFGIFLGGTGDGKSMALTHVAARAVRDGLFVAYATLEVIPPDVFARLLGNITGIPIDTIIADPTEAERQFAALPGLGVLRVHEFAPLVTTFGDVAAWVDAIEKREAREVDLLVTDYGDKLGGGGKGKRASSDSDSSYKTGLTVFEAMRRWTNERKKWHWTASQATRRKDKRKLLDVDDTADSMHKARVGELIISLNIDADRQITFRGAKNRHGAAGFNVGPIPTDFECGRIAPVVEDE